VILRCLRTRTRRFEGTMSGIAGIYYLDGRPVERTDVERMVDSISHRGPDGSGVWTDGSVGFGHRMLWTTPESLHEKLPLTNKSGDLTITADARIDNRDELFSTLNFNGRPRDTITDSELILAAYEKWGEQCPEKLLGDFSFAIWDKRKQTIFCARDPIGIKPFYYYFKEGKFRWSSEPKAIFEDKTISKEPNLSLICLYLLNRFDEREETLYKDVYRLPSSHFMVIENGRARKGQYWDIDPNHTVRYKTDEEYAEHFLSLFKDAVKVRLRSHGPVGALLSGGLDSSSIVCTAQKLYQENSLPKNGFETFSIVFDTFPCDERPYIHEVTNKYNIHANYFTYEDYLSSVDFEQTKQYHDVGYFPTLLFLAPAFREAQQKGIRVMFDGIGGDDLLTVRPDHLTDFFLQGRVQKLIAQLRYDSALFSRSPYSLFFDYCIKPVIPRPIKISVKQIIKPFRRNGIPWGVNTTFLRKNKIIDRIRSKSGNIRFPTHAQQGIYEVFRYGWNANVALNMVERFKAYFNLESRHPFFDRRLVELLLAVPEEQRWYGEWTKVILKRSLRGILPEPVRIRKDKVEFSSAVDIEFKNRQVDKVRNLIQKSTLAAEGVIHTNKLQQFFEDYLKRPTSYVMMNHLNTFVWLELWFRSVIGTSKKRR
jgi:asparagine synthase (glutamine-hydrolysing)